MLFKQSPSPTSPLRPTDFSQMGDYLPSNSPLLHYVPHTSVTHSTTSLLEECLFGSQIVRSDENGGKPRNTTFKRPHDKYYI